MNYLSLSGISHTYIIYLSRSLKKNQLVSMIFLMNIFKFIKSYFINERDDLFYDPKSVNMIIKLNIENQDLNKSRRLIFDLEYKDINAESINDLNIICKNTELNYLQLKLDHNFLEDEGVQRLMKIVICFKKLQVLHLHLGNNYFGEQGARHISIGLQKLAEMKELKLVIFKNIIYQAGAFHISDILQSTSKLQVLSLNLVECNINSTGWQQISKNLRLLTQLKHLNIILTNNNIDEQGNTDFCDFIQNNKTIVSLELSLVLNYIGQGIITLQNALIKNQVLRVLSLVLFSTAEKQRLNQTRKKIQKCCKRLVMYNYIF
ncbi:kinase domain protein, putative (macronuclear) [Tetrahymena thermophila SB210]|uniref:Kinase domain protein, putative n=1 Tax=Tetrahymena thermophila (strain SB210) TaxID=312017 RepID=Q22UR5_TETTS|nr:kinase domain protein, putative [Tetrahymena thermophila SB210]EAR89061.2 kinase domain protein, putative [Tetrahymena thermophila SB210]|eukprot:XP_001009306.2 kinase domain protein, putative [Tetrahymena thermophila SB210]